MQRLAEELGVRERDDSFCCQVGFGLGVGLVEGTIVTPNGMGCASVGLASASLLFWLGTEGGIGEKPSDGTVVHLSNFLLMAGWMR